ncbi:hypothetical protein I4641_22600 [Waterburya agarophytonicola K14]|uniref:Uncharacterized protein n=1 Tax=Waterburya agarophytonicola KI4 TaxID=2874699 RepID=A0A964BWA2_9CYAN|nr:hypothetical protein [Waterburya agarophytonicola]MCC0179736.1 hypothetical protein [Waterburya agarophytonicola KI4]
MSKLNLLTNLGIGALLFSTVGLFSVTGNNTLRAQDASSNETIENIAEDETNLYGQQVTVRGEAESIEPGMSFVIEEEGFLEGDEVLVINTSGMMLTEDSEELGIQVTGELGTLVLADVEREYDLDLDPNLYVDYENKPVIIADSITLSPSLENLSESPDNFYGQEVAIEGKIGEMKGDMAFTINDDQWIGGDDVLVINTTGEPIPTEDESVVVTGMVRPFIKSEFERDYDLTWDLNLQEEIEAEYTEKPVVVVDSIYTSAKDEGVFE